jgi:DNA repair protein RadC
MDIKLKNSKKIKLINSSDVYSVMERIYKRESKADRSKEHFWTISLDNANRILNIELVSFGTIHGTLVEPTEVYSIPLQKKATSILLIHNHPSGELKASEKDKDLTDRLIQCGVMMNIYIADHIIISEKSYYSFTDCGLMDELRQSTKYVPTFFLTEKHQKEMKKAVIEAKKKERQKNMEAIKKEKQKTMETIIRKSLKDGIPISIISNITGLSEKEIESFKPKKKEPQ